MVLRRRWVVMLMMESEPLMEAIVVGLVLSEASVLPVDTDTCSARCDLT